MDTLDNNIEAVRVRVDGLPLIGNAIDVVQRDVRGLQHDLRMVRAAINDMGHTNITAGEVEAMHEDIDRMLER